MERRDILKSEITELQQRLGIKTIVTRNLKSIEENLKSIEGRKKDLEEIRKYWNEEKEKSKVLKLF